MKKNATLLIQHIEKIYPMVPSIYDWIAHGFIAIHHDEILALGEGDGRAYIDKDTRIIEGRSHIAIPAFLDIHMDLSSPLEKVLDHERFLLAKAYSDTLLHHGTFVINTPKAPHASLSPLFASSLNVDIVNCSCKNTYVKVTPFQKDKRKATRICISTNFPETNCLDQLLCAKLYALAHPELHAQQILAACTRNPARAMGLSAFGTIKQGGRANILLLEGNTWESILRVFHGDVRMGIIKDGIRLSPQSIIS